MRRPTPRTTTWRSVVACALCAVCGATLTPRAATGAVSIHTNQIAYDARGPKFAVIESVTPFRGTETASLVDDTTSIDVAPARLSTVVTNDEWAPGEYFYTADFSAFQTAGTFHVRVTVGGIDVASAPFQIADDALANLTIPSILGYYKAQRAVSPEEWAADQAVLLNDGSKRVDLRGGWCDASGDVSKYLSHLAYANFMNPQQTPMVTWELADAAERIPDLLNAAGAQGAMQDEALWGADYLYRALSTDDYFYMVVFSFFSPNATDRKGVGLLADGMTNDKWQATFRAGGGMAIAALARISRWNKNGMYFTSRNYLDGARRAFANLLVNNTSYIDDGKENIIDDYGALMAATELWIATHDVQYRDEARKRMNNLAARMTPVGYFRADDAKRPFWHAADAGLPIVALVRYLDEESDAPFRGTALDTIKKALDYEIAVTNAVGNPYGYARQTFVYQGAVKDGFFIPQENETGWWWQGENARLASLAAAAILGGRLVYPANNGWGVDERLASLASRQVAWILGANPYDVCFMNGFGQNNPPAITANFGHGTQKGGISNGITGQEGKGDGSGIDYKTSDNGDEWRWIEQWIPHAGWFLTAVSAMAQRPPPDSR
jgi:glycosyl hydrolase family 9/cellulase-like Ig domain-containing protein